MAGLLRNAGPGSNPNAVENGTSTEAVAEEDPDVPIIADYKSGNEESNGGRDIVEDVQLEEIIQGAAKEFQSWSKEE